MTQAPTLLASCPSCGEYRLTYTDRSGRCRRCAGLPLTEWERRTDELRSASRRRADGMRRVEEHADAEWIESARRLLREYLETHAECHVDAWWAWATERGLEQPREARALGTVFGGASRAGWMSQSGRFKPSVRSNGSGKAVWLSRLYRRTT